MLISQIIRPLRQSSSSQLPGLVVATSPKCEHWTTHLVADLTLKVTGWWRTRFTLITFRLQLIDRPTSTRASKSCIADLPVCSVTCQHFQLRRCDAALVQCDLQPVLESFILPTSTEGAMVELSFERLLRDACIIDMNDMLAPSELCTEKCLYFTDSADLNIEWLRMNQVLCWLKTRRLWHDGTLTV